MPSSKAILRDIADFKLDPKVAHTKAGADGRVHGKEAPLPKKEALKVKAKEDVVLETKTPAEEKKSKQTPPAPIQSTSKNNKKAVNANDSVESSAPAGKQEAVEVSEPATVTDIDPVVV